MKAKLFSRWCLVSLAAFAIPLSVLADFSNNDKETVYVSNVGNSTIEKFTLAGVGSLFKSTANRPFGLAFDTAGNLYAAMPNNTIEKFTPAGVGSVFASTGLSAPYGLAFDAAGNLYAANPGNDTIEWFSPAGVDLGVFAYTHHPIGLAFDKAGNLYVANQYQSTITVFTPGGVGSVFADTDLNGPTGLAFDSAGNLYAANYSANTIARFTPGGASSIFANTDLNLPIGLAFDSSDNLYVANYDSSTVEKFTPTGLGTLFASNPDANQPAFIAILSEPAESVLRITEIRLLGNDVRITWSTLGGTTNFVQAKTTLSGVTTFADISGAIIPSGSGDVSASFVDPQAVINHSSRYYRIRRVR